MWCPTGKPLTPGHWRSPVYVSRPRCAPQNYMLANMGHVLLDYVSAHRLCFTQDRRPAAAPAGSLAEHGINPQAAAAHATAAGMARTGSNSFCVQHGDHARRFSFYLKTPLLHHEDFAVLMVSEP